MLILFGLFGLLFGVAMIFALPLGIAKGIQDTRDANLQRKANQAVLAMAKSGEARAIESKPRKQKPRKQMSARTVKNVLSLTIAFWVLLGAFVVSSSR